MTVRPQKDRGQCLTALPKQVKKGFQDSEGAWLIEARYNQSRDSFVLKRIMVVTFGGTEEIPTRFIGDL